MSFHCHSNGRSLSHYFVGPNESNFAPGTYYIFFINFLTFIFKIVLYIQERAKCYSFLIIVEFTCMIFKIYHFHFENPKNIYHGSMKNQEIGTKNFPRPRTIFLSLFGGQGR